MFFDLSRDKVSTITIVVALMCGALVLSIAAWSASANARERASETLARDAADASYWALFKLPESGMAALAAAGFVNAETSTGAPSGIAKSVPVLLYHGEGSGASTMPMSVFVSQMRALKDAGWHPITLAAFTAFMKGTGTVPDKSFLLTFDDGRTDTYYRVDPLLKDFGWNAVMFVITGLSLPHDGDMPANGFYLSKAQLAAMEASGRWQLESHGAMDHLEYAVPDTGDGTATSSVPGAHFLSNKFWSPSGSGVETDAEFAARITDDLSAAKTTLERDFGTPVTAYAYPFNDFGEDTVNFPASSALIAQAVRSLYTFSFYQTWTGNGDSFNYPGPRVFQVKRIEPSVSWSGQDLLSALDGGRAKPLPYEALIYGTDWGTNWGVVSGGGTLSMSASSDSTGAAAFLDGTEAWHDYAVHTSARLSVGTLSVILRHTETDAPYLVCAFSQDRIYLERHEGTAQATLASAPYAPPPLPATYTVGASVSGNAATCSAYGVSVRAAVPGLPASGGIGTSVWDPEAGTASAAIDRLSATPL